MLKFALITSVIVLIGCSQAAPVLSRDIPGKWTVAESTIPGGGDLILTLDQTGSFAADGYPSSTDFPVKQWEPLATGNWSLTTAGKTQQLELAVKVNGVERIESAQLVSGTPLRLKLVFGDPDSGKYIILQKR